VRRIPGVALGTYYATGSGGAAGARGVPHVKEMRGLVYLVKDNRKPGEVKAQVIGHPRAPARAAEAISQDTALGYCADIVACHIKRIRDVLALGEGLISIVPIPPSILTMENARHEKWRTRDLALELERRGVGKARPILVNKAAHQSKTQGARHGLADLMQMMTVLSALPADEAVLLLDDVIDHGTHLAAADLLLGQPQRVGICVVGLADFQAVGDALVPRGYTLAYDPNATVPRSYVEKRTPPSE